jgi:hypothetical protein
MDAAQTRFSPERGWAVAGAVSFPALTLALGYSLNKQLLAVALGVAGIGVVIGATLAALGRGSPVRESAWSWALAYTAGVLVYLTLIKASWPQRDIEVIVRPDGSGGLNGEQKAFLLLFSIAVTLLLGAVLDESHRATPGRWLRTAARAMGAWAVVLLPFPVLIVYGVYGAALLAHRIPFAGEGPAFLFGLICSGAMAGFVVGAIAEGVLRRVRA